MFFSPGAGRAVGPDTGLIDQGQGTFESGPGGLELAQETLLQWRGGFFGHFFLFGGLRYTAANERMFSKEYKLLRFQAASSDYLLPRGLKVPMPVDEVEVCGSP